MGLHWFNSSTSDSSITRRIIMDVLALLPGLLEEFDNQDEFDTFEEYLLRKGIRGVVADILLNYIDEEGNIIIE